MALTLKTLANGHTIGGSSGGGGDGGIGNSTESCNLIRLNLADDTIALCPVDIISTDADNAYESGSDGKMYVKDLGPDVAEAKTIAENAETVANAANTIANEAKTAAETAQTRADEAYTLAEGFDERITTAQDTADEALALATGFDERITTAQNTANDADTKAQEALDTVGTFDARITAVEEDITEAIDKADAAKTAADQAAQDAADAKYIAEVAQGTADKAATDAASALTQVGEALSTAQAAQTTADTALSTAESAQTTADTALATANGLYTINSTITDLNLEFTEPRKVYLIGTVANCPILTPCYFECLIDSGIQIVTQRVWNTDPAPFQRTGSIISDSVIWNDWEQLGNSVDIADLIADAKNILLSPVTVNSANVDLDSVWGSNLNVRINNPDNPSLPVAMTGNGTARTDTEQKTTTINFITDNGDYWHRFGSYELNMPAHNSFYNVTVTKGSDEYQCVMVGNVLAGNNTRFNIQVAERGFSAPFVSGQGNLVLNNELTFENIDPDFNNAGFTFHVTSQTGNGTQNIEVSFNSAGIATITNEVADFSTYSHITFLSSRISESSTGGFSLVVQLAFTVDAYTNVGEWQDWKNALEGISGGLNFIDDFDASSGSYDAIVSANKGDLYLVTVGGTIGSITWNPGDRLVITETSTGTPVEANIRRLPGGELPDLPLTVPNGGTGVVDITGILKGNGTDPFTVATPGVDFATAESVTNLTNTVNNIQSDITSINNSISSLETNITNIQGDISNINNTVNEIVEKVAINYSSSAQATGQTWLDGKPVYQITIDCGALPNSTSKSVPHGITLDTLISMSGTAQTEASDSFILLPYVGAYTESSFNVQLSLNTTSIIISTTPDMSNYTKSYVTITYTV